MKRPLSMTGFGRGEYEGGGKVWTVECRSVNHRFLDVKIKAPWKYAALEERIKSEIATYHARGHIDLFVSVNGGQSDEVRLAANLPLAREYFNCLQAVRRELDIAGEPDLTMLAAFRDIVGPVEDAAAVDLDEIWAYIREALQAALAESLGMRENEGQTLRDDLLGRLDLFKQAAGQVEAALPGLIRKREETLKERLDKLLQGVDIDPVRLAQEAAVIVDKSDVTEELVRLRSHIIQFADFLDLDEPVGRRLDFLLQEFLREVNTMAAKISNAETAHLIVNLKNELEKMREQVQNLE